MAKVLNRYLIKEDIQKTNKHMEICFTSYVIKEMKIQTTVHTTTHRLE